MSGSGDGLNFDFLNAPSSESVVPPPRVWTVSPDRPGESSEVDMNSLGESLPDGPTDLSGSSIFDEEPPAPVDSIEQIPDAIPNVSDGTEILVRGRTEIQEFAEEFAPSGNHAEPTFTVSPEVTLSETAPSRGAESSPTPPATAPLCESGLDDGTPSGEPPTVIEGLSFQTIASPLSMPETEPQLQPLSLSGLMELPQESGSTEAAIEADASPDHSADLSDGVGMSLGDLAGGAVATIGTISAASPTKSTPTGGNSRTALIAIGGYAIVVTALCVFLLMQVAKLRSGMGLESLPDLKPYPPNSSGKVRVGLVPIKAELPPGHSLAIGESQRLGNLKVEPLRVTAGPMEFVHFSQREKSRPVRGRVLKLWVRLTNQSADQAFVPLDRDLLFYQHIDADDTIRANNFITTPAKVAPLVFVHERDEEWDFAGQELGKVLQPGESWETYIPTTEDGIDQLNGPLLWRLQLRKGHSPAGFGVTTLVEVRFSHNEIEHEG